MHKALAEHINRGNLVHIYPEAVLYPRYNGIRGFKRGAFFLAYDCDVPVIPYVIRYVKPQGLQRFFHRKLVMRLYILDPVYPDTKRNKKDETTRLCEEVQKRMKAVSYTHLDVYKRQVMDGSPKRPFSISSSKR